ncbi:hypothetical protein TSOC_004400 [Tetrabaena socialis]|uniref:RWP-RK domain-containing protein n=1 Tax=Tetrabaena socialis TaxID=47790 RepID=A0A2J8A938_9CHLO|nr:hypothetical protein TSOC_004400 [Tetrabaena socialis]|eukprot:PNH08993.1 hypothetical protein TSOC_004400 [Tetrabaena socialis]
MNAYPCLSSLGYELYEPPSLQPLRSAEPMSATRRSQPLLHATDASMLGHQMPASSARSCTLTREASDVHAAASCMLPFGSAPLGARGGLAGGAQAAVSLSSSLSRLSMPQPSSRSPQQPWGAAPSGAAPWSWQPSGAGASPPLSLLLPPAHLPSQPAPSVQQAPSPRAPDFTASINSIGASCLLSGGSEDDGWSTDGRALTMEHLAAEIERAPWPAYPSASAAAAAAPAADASGCRPRATMRAAAGGSALFEATTAAWAAAQIVSVTPLAVGALHPAGTACTVWDPCTTWPPVGAPDSRTWSMSNSQLQRQGEAMEEADAGYDSAWDGEMEDRSATVASGGGASGGGPASMAAAASFDAVRATFDLPLSDAARALGLSESEVKRLCRVHGAERWPQRKLASLRRVAEAVEADKALPVQERQAMLAAVQRNRDAILADANTPLQPALVLARQSHYRRIFGGRAKAKQQQAVAALQQVHSSAVHSSGGGMMLLL